jgi:hypothetical protein
MIKIDKGKKALIQSSTHQLAWTNRIVAVGLMFAKVLVVAVHASTRMRNSLGSSSHKSMKSQGWDTVVLSEPEYEHLVAELHFDGQLLLLIDREDERDSLCVAFPDRSGKIGRRIPFDELLEKVSASAENLRQ